ncbi:MAG TPA: chromosome segregation protein SMC [Stellaceae bacterium]|nr:chromosome segregation protein SMC [Stellaceae bacterium]
MNFAKLRLSGFKSFVDPAELAIEPGLTGIVGPNGCGKSNLVEALRWVMGENSAKRMRGDEMDDVIFGGTTTRPARNVAEVGLQLDNTRRDAPGHYNEYDQIEVVRRIDRGEGSGFRINGREVRARDVQLLFADVASGAHSVALVSQGRIGAIINAKPIERRGLLEEAAGIAGLHSRRHEAELRLKAAETNLSRLDDVLQTLQAQLDALKKQARQAQRYRRLSDHIRRAEAMVLHLHWDAASAELAATTERLRAAEIDVADRTAAALGAGRAREAAANALPPLRQTEAVAGAELQRLVLARQALDEEERRVAAQRAAAAERLTQLAADLAREEELAADARAALARLDEERHALLEAQAQEQGAQRATSATLAAAIAAVTALDAELTQLTEQVAADEAGRVQLLRQQEEATEREARLIRRQEEIAQQRAVLEAEAISAAASEEAASALAAAETEVERTRAAADAAGEAHREAQAATEQARAPLQALETRRTKLRAEIQALTELLAAAGDKRWPPILDAVAVEPGFEAALGAALGDDLTAPPNTEAPTHWHALPAYAYALALPGNAVPLARYVRAPDALARRLSQIGVVADAETAAQWQRLLVPGQRLVTRDGGLWRWDGYRRAAGTPSAAGQRLRQRNRLVELGEELRLVEGNVATEGAAFAELQAAERRLGDSERGERQAMRDALAQLARAQEHDAELRRRAAATASRLSGLAESAERLAADLAETEALARAAAEGLVALPDPALARARVAGLRHNLYEGRTAQSAAQTEHDRVLRESRARGERLDAIAAETRSWQTRAEATQRQRATIEERRAEVTAEIERLDRRPEEIAEQRRHLLDAIAQSTARRNDAADALAQGETRLTETERASKAADAALAQSREERVRCEAAREQAEHNRQTMAQRIAERLDCAPNAILAATGIDAEETLPSTEEAEARFLRLSRERDGMGPVNLVAETEAQEVEKRLLALTRERDDLIAAIARLREGISALNREGRERLMAAFAQVNEHFAKLFTHLFGGGRAHLTLDKAEDGDETRDPLEAGLEIMASPPGKRLQLMSLLSGGEQALTALALLFAVFLTNPAPICVLDEVDAPLDDANVDRFCHLVEEIAESARTRFLIITHHRLTMARMDRLFGVTMAERGISQLVSVDLQRAQELRRTA